MTSPLTVRCISVTSSGRSSISRTIRCTSGWLWAMLSAISRSSTVLPDRGGATIRARWPLPSGVSRSITRVETVSESFSSTICWVGFTGVSASNFGRSSYSSGGRPSTDSISLSRGPCPRLPGPTSPTIFTPSRSRNRSTRAPETNGSLSRATKLLEASAEEPVTLGVHFEHPVDRLPAAPLRGGLPDAAGVRRRFGRGAIVVVVLFPRGGRGGDFFFSLRPPPPGEESRLSASFSAARALATDGGSFTP